MARGAEGKAARKQAKKEAKAKEAERILNGDGAPPSYEEAAADSGPNVVDDSSSDEEGEGSDSAPEKTPEKKKKKSKSARAGKAAARRTAAAEEARQQARAAGDGGGIKTLPLIMLIMLTGTTVLPALLYMGDYFSAFIAKNHLMGNLGHRLGIGPSPKKRVISFYEKHDPEKVLEVNSILAKYYGDYPKLVKRLERKYGDYGYFINWEKDEAPMTLALEQIWETHEQISKQFDKHAPAVVKTGARNVRANLTFLYKKGNVVWKKTIWPVLQPYLGVPDAKAAKKQKLQDKKDADRRKKEASGQRRKSAEFRDDDEM